MRKHNYLLFACFLILFAPRFEGEERHALHAKNLDLPKYAVHYIQRGDNLYLLAAYYLDSPRKWEVIYQENRNAVSDPNELIIGRKLLIPLSTSWERGETFEKFKARLASKVGLEELAVELIQTSGMYRRIHGILPRIKIEIERDSLNLGLAQDQIYISKARVTDSLGPSALVAKVTLNLENSLNETELKELLKWYTSPPGSKITEMEKQGLSPEEWKNSPRISKRLKSASLTDIKRVELLSQLESLTNYTEREIELRRSLFFAAASASLDRNAIAETGEGDLRSLVNEQKSGFFSELEEEMIFSLMFIYEKLSDRELTEYINFLKTGAYQRFTKAVYKPLNESIIDSFR